MNHVLLQAVRLWHPFPHHKGSLELYHRHLNISTHSLRTASAKVHHFFSQALDQVVLCQSELSTGTAGLSDAQSSTHPYINPQPQRTEELSASSLFLIVTSQLQLGKFVSKFVPKRGLCIWQNCR